MVSYQRGKCLLQPVLNFIGMKQAELARRTGYSARMVSHYATNKKPMSPEAMYTITTIIQMYLPNFRMEHLYEWEREQ
ncbi:XRE family transcriptional regulator [Brevibacillus laterosporus]|nr:helix-turn-helix transcriptional regulator [Brevibacillus laterosporus]TPG73175.1 XRE family transcriptional regulator [Brevibacillus laterosporus]TPG74737.1 XRE family transcriptional regulator [Brevibacillus laterosporus]TPG74747.1 XRE family transcriptional regulator [Brevibacillus laterosporus]